MLTSIDDFIAYEQLCLWGDLDEAIRNALNGKWSIGAAGYALRIVRAIRVSQPSRYSEVPWRLLAGGVYEAVVRLADVKPELPDDDEWFQIERRMHQYGGTHAQLAQQYAATVAVIKTPAESAFIRDES